MNYCTHPNFSTIYADSYGVTQVRWCIDCGHMALGEAYYSPRNFAMLEQVLDAIDGTFPKIMLNGIEDFYFCEACDAMGPSARSIQHNPSCVGHTLGALIQKICDITTRTDHAEKSSTPRSISQRTAQLQRKVGSASKRLVDAPLPTAPSDEGREAESKAPVVDAVNRCAHSATRSGIKHQWCVACGALRVRDSNEEWMEWESPMHAQESRSERRVPRDRAVYDEGYADGIATAYQEQRQTGILGALNDVAVFHDAGGIPECSGPPALTRAVSRLRFLREEYHEYVDASVDRDINEVADAIADIIYIALGSALIFFGRDRFSRVWDEVQRSNMAKVWDNGKLNVREDGKILKPEGWEPPDIAGALEDK